MLTHSLFLALPGGKSSPPWVGISWLFFSLSAVVESGGFISLQGNHCRLESTLSLPSFLPVYFVPQPGSYLPTDPPSTSPPGYSCMPWVWYIRYLLAVLLATQNQEKRGWRSGLTHHSICGLKFPESLFLKTDSGGKQYHQNKC